MSAPLLPHNLYRIELCSGEQRRWRYRGEDAQGNRWWRDEESGQEFNEASLMYAWQVLGPAEPAGPAPGDLPASIHRLLAEQMDGALILADKEGIIRLWNAAATALFGFSAATAIGASLDLIIPEHLRAAPWRGFHQAMAQGAVQHPGQPRLTRALQADGQKRYVSMSFSVIRDDAGQTIGSLALAWAADKPAGA